MQRKTQQAFTRAAVRVAPLKPQSKRPNSEDPFGAARVVSEWADWREARKEQQKARAAHARIKRAIRPFVDEGLVSAYFALLGLAAAAAIIVVAVLSAPTFEGRQDSEQIWFEDH